MLEARSPAGPGGGRASGAAGPLSQPSSSFSRQVGVRGAAVALGPLAVLTVGRLWGRACSPPAVGGQASLERFTQTRRKALRQDEAGLQPGLIYSFGEDRLCNCNSKTMCFLDEVIRQALGNVSPAGSSSPVAGAGTRALET